MVLTALYALTRFHTRPPGEHLIIAWHATSEYSKPPLEAQIGVCWMQIENLRCHRVIWTVSPNVRCQYVAAAQRQGESWTSS